MSFTGKATYTAGTALPEIAEDVSDLVGINSPHETPLLDALGDPPRSARSTVHEWLEDALLPNTDTVNDSTYGNATTDTSFVVDNGSRFRVGDQIRTEGSGEVMLVTAVNTGTNTLTVVRGYGGSTAEALADNLVVHILGNAALEGDDASSARFTARSRKTNYTQIFSATVEVSGSELAVKQLGGDYNLVGEMRLRAARILDLYRAILEIHHQPLADQSVDADHSVAAQILLVECRHLKLADGARTEAQCLDLHPVDDVAVGHVVQHDRSSKR